MMEFGNSLRAAREAKGYSVAQLAELTRLAPNTINDLENDNVKHIAAPIYGRGFVRLYCEAVGLDPKPFVSEFMEILNGNRDPVIRERPTAAPAEPPAPADVATAPEPEAPAVEPEAPAGESEAAPEPPPQVDLFRQPPRAESEFASGSAFGEVREPIPEPVTEPPAESPASAPKQTVSRYIAPVRSLVRTPPPTVWRIGVLALAAIALVTLLIYGLRALRRATAPDGMPTDPAPVVERETTRPERKPAAGKSPETRQPEQKPAAPREQQKIPALYVD